MPSKAKILIVDDEQHICNLLSKLLERLDYQVVGCANSGKEAVDKVRETTPDAILMDILMEGRTDGIKAAKEIQDITDAPLIFSTGESDAAIISEALETKPFGYINKPFTADVLKTTIDISLIRYKYEKKLIETQNALQASESLFRGIYNNTQSGYFQLDKDYNFTLTNPSMLKILEAADEKQISGKNIFYTFFLEAGEAENFKSDLAKNGEIQLTDARWKALDDSAKFVLFNINQSSPTNGNGIAYTGTVQDITKYKNLETQLRHAQKMEVIGTLSSRIAHEINNQLTTVLGYADLCQMTMDKENRQYKYITSIRKKAGEAMETTRHLLKFGRKQKAVLTQFNVDELIEEKQELVRHVIGSRVELTLNLDSGSTLINGDPKLLEQVLMNLIINARDAMDMEGKLVISTKILDENAENAWSQKLPHRNFLNITVKDTGHGIPASKLEEIFEPFYTTKSESIGTGLGLPVVNSIIKEIKGYLFVDSKPDVGTSFDIFLPLSAVGAEVVSSQ